jgi:hypothetical protein
VVKNLTGVDIIKVIGHWPSNIFIIWVKEYSRNSILWQYSVLWILLI